MSKTISSKDAGKDCDWSASTESVEELMSLVTEHALAEHKEIELNSEIRIEKAYVTKFRDNLQLNLGFYGKLFLLLNNTESV